MSLVRNWRPQLKEKIVYISADGSVYDLHNPIPNSVLSMSGWGLIDAEYGLTRGPFQHGYTVLTSRLNQRVITVEIRHRGCNRTDYWSKRTGLVDILRQNRTNLNNPSPGHLRWYRADGLIRQADVYIAKGPDFKTLGNGAWDEFSFNDILEFKAYNPVIYDPTQIQTSLLDFTCSSSTQLTFPFTFGGTSLSFGDSVCEKLKVLSVNYLGKWSEYPIIKIQGPATNTRIVHNETGNVIELDYAIASDELVTIDLSYSKKTISNNHGTNLLGYLSNDSNLGSFSIEPDPIVPNGTNTYSITIQSGSVSTSVEFDYYSRYPGI